MVTTTTRATPEGAAAPIDSLQKAYEFLAEMQHQTGYWEAEMVWNSMLLSQWVMVQKIVGRLDAIPDDTRDRILKQYEVTRTPEGGWGMHGEGGPYVFMTALAYVALRLLGLPPEHPLCAPARDWLQSQPGGVRAIPTWGKFWLSMLGLYEYEGVNPIPPELFLLPEWVPLHPNNYYCHTRYIYLGIAYLYGRRFKCEIGPIRDELRRELYGCEYDEIDFAQHRHDISPSDVHVRPSLPLRTIYDTLTQYEKRPVRALRERALRHCFGRIVYEQEASRGQGLSPVNGLLNCLALYAERHPLFESSLSAMESWKWEDEAEGIRYAGAHSTSWDTAFAMRAMLEAPARVVAAPTASSALHKAYDWLRDAQMQTELPPGFERERREPVVGGWCFSDGVHRWAVSDCTAEAMTALLEANDVDGLIADGARIAEVRLEAAARFILRRQNGDGGFGSYESRRGSLILEYINPSEMYGNCMTERSYTECTASCVGALARFRARFPATLRDEIDRAVARGVQLLRSRQLADGSYLGFWGVNFTYAIFHVVEGLRAAGVPATDPAIARAIDWLLQKQKRDGGWGEHWRSAQTDSYVEHPESQAAMTAWALLALMEALPPTHAAILRGIECLKSMQLADGQWPRQAQSGVFFSTAMLDYRLYKDYFPAWALARFSRLSSS
ncbi:MAG TPA: prenyltransferase/squalene oxidase repeat-containing protein [Polyangia bacterium]